MFRFVYFVSAHGFGHAARAAAVIAAVRRRLPASRFQLLTTVPAWFFADSLGEDVPLAATAADLGLVQSDPLREDLPATVEKLRERIPFRDAEVDALARRLDEARADLVLCDITPLGLAAARRAGVPSVLIENFTWDYIYRGYRDEHPELGAIADYLGEIFAAADHHVQMEPFCVPAPGARRVGPVCRTPRRGRAEVRAELGVPEAAPLVMITMGGIDWRCVDPDLDGDDAPWVVNPGGGEHHREGRFLRLPHRSELYHPDLVHAADAVVAKLGYSTVAEVHHAGLPLAYLARDRFPESPHVEAWVRERLPCRRIEPEELADGRWLESVRPLLRSPRRPPETSDGAAQIAEILAEIVGAA